MFCILISVTLDNNVLQLEPLLQFSVVDLLSAFGSTTSFDNLGAKFIY